MSKKNKLIIIFFFVGTTLLGKSSSFNYQQNWDHEALENFLKTAEIISIDKETETGRTALWRLTLDDGKIQRKAFFKHLNRPRPSFLADSYKYEIAAYKLNKLLHLNLVPPTVEREINGIKGSTQLFLEGWITESTRKRKQIQPPDPEHFNNILEVINVFENLVYDENCFDSDDTLINTDEWKICRVDFSMAFNPVSALISGCRISKCSDELYNNLLQLNESQVKDYLKDYLNAQEIEALFQRRKIILGKIEKLIKEKGEKSVLFNMKTD